MLHSFLLDNGLLGGHTYASRLLICSSEPTTYAQAVSYQLGYKDFPASLFEPPTSAGSNGRKIVSLSFTGGVVTAAGTATHWAAADANFFRLLATGPITNPQLVELGNVFEFPSFSVIIYAALGTSGSVLAEIVPAYDVPVGVWVTASSITETVAGSDSGVGQRQHNPVISESTSSSGIQVINFARLAALARVAGTGSFKSDITISELLGVYAAENGSTLYVTEAGTVFYGYEYSILVAEDGVTEYVAEDGITPYLLG